MTEADSKQSSTPIVSDGIAAKKAAEEKNELTESDEQLMRPNPEVGKSAASNPKERAVTDSNVKEEMKEEAADPSAARGGKFAAMASKRQKDMVTSPAKPDKPESAKSSEEPSMSITKDSKGRLVKVIDDDEEEMDCEFLNNRQLFLNLCQGNHYQFDQVRRAKHTSMMVLWHLHNRDAPKFVQQCAVCSQEILIGK